MPEVIINRCQQPTDFGHICRAELHHFSDALMTAYGSASYIRLTSVMGKVSCNLMFTRSRVTTLKQMTIPRLELAAATLSVQQDEIQQDEIILDR